MATQGSVVPANALMTPGGDQGPTGAQSTTPGPQGPPGAASTVPGPQGPPGADSTVPGPTGPPGSAATISVGTTSTLTPGSAATVNNSGSSSAAVFNFGIPAGVKGDKGDTGAPGSGSIVAATTTADVTLPAADEVSVVYIPVSTTTPFLQGQSIWVERTGTNGYYLTVNSVDAANSRISVFNAGVFGTQAGFPVASGSRIFIDGTNYRASSPRSVSIGLLGPISTKTTDFVDGTNTCQDFGSGMQSAFSATPALRGFNALGNFNFEIDQRTAGAGTTVQGFACDRWFLGMTIAGSAKAVPTAQTNGVVIPGTSPLYPITSKFLRTTLLTQKASLAASDLIYFQHYTEGPMLRPLIGGGTKVTLLVRCSAANQTFSICLRDSTSAYSIAKAFTIPSANTWTLITLNFPNWTSNVTFPLTPGGFAYTFVIGLAVGSTFTAPSNDLWNAGNFVGALGQSNFMANAVNTTFDIAFAMHEPGSGCGGVIDDQSFSARIDDCLRYYTKTYDYDVAVGTANAVGNLALTAVSATGWYGPIRYPKPMAKIPTIVSYSATTGAASQVRSSGADYAVASYNTVGKSGFQGINTSTGPTFALGLTGYVHYTADTGW